MFGNMSVEKLMQRMLARVDDRLDKREGSVIYDALAPAAMELMALYIELERVLSEAYGDTASREFLILRCRERGISPRPATQAVLRGLFRPADIDVTGRRFSIGELNYTVQERMPDGSFKVMCESAGTEGNRFFGSMIPIDYIDGLESAELTELLIPGEDEEDTEALRSRYFSSFDVQAFGGNIRDYTDRITSIPGVGAVKITRVWNGDIEPSSLVPPEGAGAWVSSVAGSLPTETAEWLTRIYNAAADRKLTTGGCVLATLLDSEFSPASQTLIGNVKETLDPDPFSGGGMGLAPIGHVVNVRSAVGVPINVTAEILCDNGYSSETLRGAIEEAVSDYLLELRRSWADSAALTVRISQLETRILGIRGVLDISGTAINGEHENLTLSRYEAPVYGSAEVSER